MGQQDTRKESDTEYPADRTWGCGKIQAQISRRCLQLTHVGMTATPVKTFHS